MRTLTVELSYIPVMKLLVLPFWFGTVLIGLVINMPGCTKNVSVSIPANEANPVHALPYKRYLALGDSYTIGQSVAPKERFPYLVDSLLRKQNIPIKDPKYIATTGWTTLNLLNAINAAGTLGTFDAVTLLIGVNDQFQRMDTAAYRTRFTQLLLKGIKLTGNNPSKVFVLSIPDYSATPYVDERQKQRVSREIDQFNAINKEVTLNHGIIYVDITPLTREAAHDSTLLCSDELHYSAKEHQKWAELLAPLMKNVLL